MNFKEAYELPIGEHVEKKGKFSYLSWSFAVKHLRENFPDATWIIHEEDGAPARFMAGGWFVKVSVILNDKHYTQWHPVLDNRNNPIKDPTVFQINTSIQRCLTKAIAIATGIGLGLYAGEDLPKDEPKKKAKPKPKKYSDFVADIDTMDGVQAINDWLMANWGQVKIDLSELEAGKFEEYAKSIRKVFEA